MSMNRRGFLRSAAVLTVVATAAGGALSGCGETAQVKVPEGLAKAGTTIPSATVKMGLSPNADELIPAIGVERGYYKDVGISIAPGPYGAKTDLLTSVTPLLNGQVAVGTGYAPTVLPQLDAVRNVKVFAVMDVYYGYRILAPKGKYKTVSALMEEGQSFADAAKTAVSQMRGKTFLRNEATSPTFFNLAYELGGLEDGDFNLVLLDNPGVVRAALAGRGDFAAPTGAADILELESRGWEPIIDVRQMFDNIPEKTLPLRATNSGFLATDAYINDNYETVLRLTSVMYRIIDDLKRDPLASVEVFRDYVNSYTGNDLTAAQLKEVIASLYSFRDFDEAAEFFGSKKGAFSLAPAYAAQIATLKEGKVLKGEHQYSDLILAEQVWEDLQRYRSEAERLFEVVEEKDPDLARRAREQFDARNYLDAYRLLASASST
jgi:ABC-type nitrate/sulfonate/bicarbonate transport system substrate-binding protein